MAARRHDYFDTSVARLAILGTSRYKEYLELSHRPALSFVSDFILMEFRRGFLAHAIAFYLSLFRKDLASVGDALSLWSNRFSGREIKAIALLVSQVERLNRIDSEKEADLDVARDRIAKTIMRIEMKFRLSFKNSGVDSTRCSRALVRFPTDVSNLHESLQRYYDSFEDTQECRNSCSIESFFFRKYKNKLDGILNAPITKPKNRGFEKLRDDLKLIFEKGTSGCHCKACGKVGDAIIALDMSDQMQLVHTDNSFNAICKHLNIPHKQLLSEAALRKSGQSR